MQEIRSVCPLKGPKVFVCMPFSLYLYRIQSTNLFMKNRHNCTVLVYAINCLRFSFHLYRINVTQITNLFIYKIPIGVRDTFPQGDS